MKTPQLGLLYCQINAHTHYEREPCFLCNVFYKLKMSLAVKIIIRYLLITKDILDKHNR